MLCPHCDHDVTEVVETRKHKGEVWRRRRCRGCRKVFFSREYASTELRMPEEITEAARRRLRGEPPPREIKVNLTSLPW